LRPIVSPPHRKRPRPKGRRDEWFRALTARADPRRRNGDRNSRPVPAGSFTLRERVYLTYRYRGSWSLLYRAITYPLRFTPFKRFLNLGPDQPAFRTAAQLSQLPRAELLALADELSWVHAIDLGGGYVTPGAWGEGNPVMHEAMEKIDFRGAKVLDIGCWDGRFSFEAERRGAREVHATDLVTHRPYGAQPTLEVARAALDSRVVYHPQLSVYDLQTLGVRDFDVVIFAGVYYHLKDPLLALSVIRRVMRPGATMLFEGAIIEESGCFARFYYQDPYLGDPTNWWVPTAECARQWVTCSFFEIAHEFQSHWVAHNPRLTLLAAAVERADPFYMFPDERLAGFATPAEP
jgi:tRNA (mo5U34)-methyltransferase